MGSRLSSRRKGEDTTPIVQEEYTESFKLNSDRKTQNDIAISKEEGQAGVFSDQNHGQHPKDEDKTPTTKHNSTDTNKTKTSHDGNSKDDKIISIEDGQAEENSRQNQGDPPNVQEDNAIVPKETTSPKEKRPFWKRILPANCFNGNDEDTTPTKRHNSTGSYDTKTSYDGKSEEDKTIRIEEGPTEENSGLNRGDQPNVQEDNDIVPKETTSPKEKRSFWKRILPANCFNGKDEDTTPTKKHNSTGSNNTKTSYDGKSEEDKTIGIEERPTEENSGQNRGDQPNVQDDNAIVPKETTSPKEKRPFWKRILPANCFNGNDEDTTPTKRHNSTGSYDTQTSYDGKSEEDKTIRIEEGPTEENSGLNRGDQPNVQEDNDIVPKETTSPKEKRSFWKRILPANCFNGKDEDTTPTKKHNSTGSNNTKTSYDGKSEEDKTIGIEEGPTEENSVQNRGDQPKDENKTPTIKHNSIDTNDTQTSYDGKSKEDETINIKEGQPRVNSLQNQGQRRNVPEDKTSVPNETTRLIDKRPRKPIRPAKNEEQTVQRIQPPIAETHISIVGERNVETASTDRTTAETELTQKCNNLRQENDRLRNELTHILSLYNDVLVQLQSARADADDALRRLSETMSLHLRDNNPNIVDLSDQYRPTKLAELMNELYDNQWTDVFSYIENHWNGDGEFQEKQCIQFLLHIVMEVYTFCTYKGTVEWTSEINRLLGSTDKELLKMIKDNKKKNAFDDLPDVQQSCLEALQQIPLSDDSRFDITIEVEAMKAYLNECIRLSWLMVVQDPPIYLQCSGWESKQQNVRMVDGMQEMSNAEINEDTNRTDEDRNTPDKLGRLNHTEEGGHGLDTLEGLNDMGDTAELATGSLTGEESTVSQDDTSLLENAETEKQPGSESVSEIDEASNRKVAFVKDHYKEYTKRGEYIDYIVWPVMFLHEGGPLLSKGVAQGCK